jgi:hypothetical protein
MKSSKPLTCRFASCSSPSTWIETAVSCKSATRFCAVTTTSSRVPSAAWAGSTIEAAITEPEMASETALKRGFLCNCFIMLLPAVRQP